MFAGASGQFTSAPRAANTKSSRVDHVHPPLLSAVAGSAPLSTAKLPQGGFSLAISIDGAKNPERISDRIAYNHFIMVTAKTANASAEQFDRRESLLRQVGLSKEDHESYVAALTNVREELDRIASERRQWPANGTASERAALTVLKQQEYDVLEDARLRLETALSPEGKTRLQRHIRGHVKRRIVVYGTPPPI